MVKFGHHTSSGILESIDYHNAKVQVGKKIVTSNVYVLFPPIYARIMSDFEKYTNTVDTL